MLEGFNALLFWADVAENPGRYAIIFSIVVLGVLLLTLHSRLKSGGVLVFRSSTVDGDEGSWEAVERPPEVSLYRRGVLVTYQVSQGESYDPERLRRLRLTAADRRTVLAMLGVHPRWSTLAHRQEPAVALRKVRQGNYVFELPDDSPADPALVREWLIRRADEQAARSTTFKPWTWVVRLVPTEKLAGRTVQRWTAMMPLDDFGHALVGHPGVRCRSVNSTSASDLAAALGTADVQRRPVYAAPGGGFFEVRGRGLLDDELVCPCEAQHQAAAPDASPATRPAEP